MIIYNILKENNTSSFIRIYNYAWYVYKGGRAFKSYESSSSNVVIVISHTVSCVVRDCWKRHMSMGSSSGIELGSPLSISCDDGFAGVTGRSGKEIVLR